MTGATGPGSPTIFGSALGGLRACTSAQEARAVAMQLRVASDQGDAEAANLLATLSAAGAWVEQDWMESFRRLRQAAENASSEAVAQLAILRDACAAEGDEGVDLEALLTPAPRRALSERPRVRVCDRFITPSMCRWLIGLAQGRLRPARTFEDGEARLTANRTNSQHALDVIEGGVVLALARARIAAMLQTPLSALEQPQILHYAVGQEFRPHVDYLRRPDLKRLTAREGDRIATFLVYLNEDFEAGETWFPRAKLKVRPLQGGAVYFANVTPQGAPDPDSLHAGLAPTRGEKWVLSQWVRDRAFNG